MIEQAFISGQLGRAIYSEGGHQFVLGADDVERPRHCSGADVAMFFRSGAEYFAPKSISEFGELASALKQNTRAYKALTLVISSFDAEMEDIRELVIEAAEELLAGQLVSDFVRRRLLARPLPVTADIESASHAAKAAGALLLWNLLDTVRKSQFAIVSLLSAWNETAKGFFSSEEETIEAERLLVESGVFDQIISKLVAGDLGALDSVVLEYSLDPSVSAEVPRARHLFTAIRNKVRESLNLKRRKKETETRQSKSGRSGITDLLSRFDENVKSTQKRFSPFEAKARVDLQIKSIKALIIKRDISLASKWVRDLVEFQVGHGEKQHMGMTLCSLATAALEAGETDFAATLIAYAEALGIEDPVIFGSKGEILKTLGNLSGALEEFDDAIRRFPSDPLLGSERADVLKVMGRFDEALKQYNEEMCRFPSSEVIWNGRAETLKAMGRLDEALKQYDEAVERFPGDVVARSGRAETLKGMGRFDEALKQYDEAVEHFPGDVVVRNGRAETLKAMGRLDEALKQYDEAVERFPGDVVARSGRAETLKGMGRFDEALKQYDEAVERFPCDAVARSGRAETLKGMGRFDEALKQYGEAVERFPHKVVARNGRAETLKAMGRFDEALKQYDEAIKRFPGNAVARNGRAETLKGMGRFDEALKQYDEEVERFPGDVVARTGRAEALKAMGRLDEALEQFKEARRAFPHDSYLLCGQLSVLLLQNRIVEARDLLLPETEPTYPDDWVRYHMLAMMYLKSGNIDAAIARLSRGVKQAPWQSARFFVNSLAVAMMRKEEFKNALPLLQRGLGLLEATQRQRRLALIGHSQAAIGARNEAVISLRDIGEAAEPNVTELKRLLFDRYNLVDDNSRISVAQYPFLEIQIAQKEFLLAVA